MTWGFIDDMIANAAYNESQKTFQQMSQRESLTLAKDMIKLNQRQTGYAGMWLVSLVQSTPSVILLYAE
jgi:hypothetical protein